MDIYDWSIKESRKGSYIDQSASVDDKGLVMYSEWLAGWLPIKQTHPPPTTAHEGCVEEVEQELYINSYHAIHSV